MKKVRISIGIAAAMLAVSFNFYYAYNGYGIGKSGLVQAYASDTGGTGDTETSCGTAVGGGKILCHARKESIMSPILCDIYYFMVYATPYEVYVDKNGETITKEYGERVIREDKSSNMSIWSQDETAGVDPHKYCKVWARRGYTKENVFLPASECIEDSRAGACEPTPPDCKDYDRGGNS